MIIKEPGMFLLYSGYHKNGRGNQESAFKYIIYRLISTYIGEIPD